MKRSLPFLLGMLLFAFLSNTALAQQFNKRNIQFTKKENEKLKHYQQADIPLASPNLVAPPPVQDEVVQFREGPAFSVPMGSSYNIYSVVSEGPNPVSYHPDLNTIIFCHRQNFPHPGGSGIMSFDVSTDVGASWDTVTRQVTPNLMTPDGIPINGNRYPNGSIYNPPGNTDPANAYFVGTGAALWDDPAFGNGWGYEWVASAKLDGSLVDENYYSTADTNIYLSMGMTYNPDGSQWYVNYRREQNFAHQLFNPLYATKLEFNSTNNNFDRTTIELPLDYSSGLDSISYNPRIAFSPDGQTGYTVITGIDADDTEIYPSIKPVIWKTTDGGDTWTKQARVEYQTMDSLLAWTIPIDGDGDGMSDSLAQGSPQIPFMSMFDITVDADGMLHIFASMLSSADTASTAAEFGTVWVGVGTLELFHFITDGENWENYRVSDWYNEDGPIGTEFHDERLQASRSVDGQYVFFTYGKTWYSEIEEGNENSNPDIYGYAYRLSDGYVVDPKNFGLIPGTEFEDFEFTDVGTIGFLHMLAPVSIQGGEFWNHELPIVYGVPRDFGDDLQPVDYYFLRSAGFDEAEFHPRGMPVDVEEVSVLAEQIRVFPNPTDGQLSIDLSSIDAMANIYVFDALGRQVSALRTQRDFAELDLKQKQTGLYSVVIHTEKGTITKKVIVQ